MANLKIEDSKVVREKQRVSYKGTPIRLSADFSTETAGQKRAARYIQTPEREQSTA